LSKNKPKETIEYVIRLQDKERQLLNDYLNSQIVNNYAKAIDQVSSFTNLYFIVTLIEIITGKEILPGTPNDIYQLIDNIRDFRKTGFTDPDGATGFEGFWDVSLTRELDRFFGIKF